MLKFAANLTMMYKEHLFPDRFAAAAGDGFRGVEFLFPYAYAVEEIRARLQDNGLTQVLFNCPPGDWANGERGIASLPGREQEFKRSVESALGYAEALGTTRLHVMAGLIQAVNIAHEREHPRDWGGSEKACTRALAKLKNSRYNFASLGS